MDTVDMRKAIQVCEGRKITMFEPLFLLIASLLAGIITGACGTIATEPAGIEPWTDVPDPKVFATEIEPLLVTGCAAAECHGRKTTFSLTPPDTPPKLPQELASPEELPEPTRSNYYTVLAFCDPDVPSASTLLRWACGQEMAHAAGSVLTAAECGRIVDWLEAR